MKLQIIVQPVPVFNASCMGIQCVCVCVREGGGGGGHLLLEMAFRIL